ncbi:MAG: 3-hydroxybutyryl-CoA dehydrogenase [Planctomycetota bacterium]|nr:3-hydroxybutyryl-CoA dehydrogenase [Planctomycetota bacterium]
MSELHFPKVAVIGAGTMGNGIAQVFASGGSQVLLVDTNADALASGQATIEKNLGRMVSKGRMAKEDAEAALGRLQGATALTAITDQSLVVEAIVEREDVKTAVFAELDSITLPDAVLASNTSSISITTIASATKRPKQVIGMHFMNPVPLMKLVEVIRGQATSDEVTRKVMESSAALGKTPVEVNDSPGFVSNRILMPMINEAAFCLMEGVADCDGIDTVMKLGMAHPMGPLSLADLIGLDVCLDIMNVLHQGFGDSKYLPCPLLERMVADGHLGRKTGKGFYDYA